MSVIVKGMEMPDSCGRCWFNNSSLSCAITGSCIDRDDENRERLDDCPLVALPDKHGQLKDADALIIDLMDRGLEGIQTDDWAEIQQTVTEQPTIVEAEGEP